jgi:hypothetical protein
MEALGKVTFKVQVDAPIVDIQFESSSRGSTVFGHQADDPVSLTRAEVLRLPHNFVHAVLSSDLMAPDIMGLTPDIGVWDEEGRMNIIEVVTTSNPEPSVLLQAMLDKALKYDELVQLGKVYKLNVVGVSPIKAYSLNGEITGFDGMRLKHALRKGLEIRSAFEKEHGHQVEDEDPEKRQNVREILTSTEWETYNKVFNMDPIFPTPFPMRLCLRREPLIEDWNSFFRTRTFEKDGTRKRDASHDTVVHLPWVNCTRSDEPLVKLSDGVDFGEDIYSKLAMAALWRSELDSQLDVEELETISMVMGGQKKKLDSSQILEDEVLMNCNKADRIELAMRGVMKKELEMAHEPIIQMKVDLDKKDIDINSDTSNIHEFIHTPMESVDDCAWVSDQMEPMFGTDGSGDFVDLFTSLLRIKDVHRLMFLELIVREVSYNMHRNPKDHGQGKHFIIRRIPGFAASIVIRTTRMSGEEGAPVFVMLVYHTTESIDNRIFESSWGLGGKGWYRTNFFSLSVRKIEHLQGICAQSLALLGLCIEQTAGGLTPVVEARQLDIVQPMWRCLILILLEDKQNTSSNLQQLRYYYMELFSGMPGCKGRSLKVLAKFSDVVRTPLMCYLYQGLRDCHERIPDDIDKKVFQPKPQADEESEGSLSVESVADAEAEIISEPIMTPFGFEIRSPDEMLLASYVCMLHNKNESNYGHGSVQIMEKLCKRQIQRIRLQGGRSSYDFHVIKGAADPEEMTEFQHSEQAVFRGCELIKKRISSIRGWDLESWDEHSMDLMLDFALKECISELATTKSSTLPFNPDLTVTRDGDEINSVGCRQKCFAAMIEIAPSLESEIVALNLHAVIKGIVEEEGGVLQVSLFKKNQIGGTREIFVLSMRGRMLVKVFCDLFRAICEAHPSERLTDDKSKDLFVGHHFEEVHKLQKPGSVTAKVSGDMTNWAQLFSLHDFMSMCKSLLPQSLWGFCSMVLQMHHDKRIQLPKQLIEMFLSRPDSILSSPSVNELKRQFLSGGSLINKFGTAIHAETDMMQGILHYPSSAYHLAHMEFLSAVIKDWSLKQGVEVVVSFEVSSDDEGLLISFCGEKSVIHLVSKRFTKVYPHIKHTVDVYFGVRSSFEKTTFSFADLFEFNSKFYVGNTVSSPLIKFVARAIDDNPQESLARRVSSLYSSLRQLRENGGSGFLCSWVSACQGMNYYMNLGVGTMLWMKSGTIHQIIKKKLTCLGYYEILSPLIAGLVDGTYVNWKHSTGDADAQKILHLMMSYALPQDLDDLETSMFGVYPTKKYKALKRRLGLEFSNRSDFVTEHNLITFLSRPGDLASAVEHMKRSCLNPTVAASMSWLTRTTTLRLTPYLMWSAMFHSKTRDQKVPLRTLISDMELRTLPRSVGVQTLFPMWRQFASIKSMTETELVCVPLSSRRRLRYQFVAPYYSVGDHRSHLKDALREHWYSKRSRHLSPSAMDAVWVEIKSDIPFLSDDGPMQTLASSPFDTLDQLLGYFESYVAPNKLVKLLARGSVDRAGLSVDRLLRYNISPFYHFTTMAEVSAPGNDLESLMMTQVDVRPGIAISASCSAIMMRVEDRLKAWVEILHRCEEGREEDLHDMLILDLRSMIDPDKVTLLKTMSTGSERLDKVRDKVLFMLGELLLTQVVRRSDRITVWLETQQRVGTRFFGPERAYIKRKNVTMKYDYDGQFAVVTSSNPAYEVRDSLRRRQIDRIHFGQVIIPEASFSGIRMIKGTRVIVARRPDGNYCMINFPDVKPHSLHSRRVGLLPLFIEKWLCREELTAEDLRSAARILVAGGPNSTFVKACISYAKRVTSSKVMIRVQERMGTQQQADITEDLIDMHMDEFYAEFADDFGEGADLIDLRSFYMEGNAEFAAEAQGLMAFRLEDTFTTLDINPSLRKLTGKLDTLIDFKDDLVGDMGELIRYFASA